MKGKKYLDDFVQDDILTNLFILSFNLFVIKFSLWLRGHMCDLRLSMVTLNIQVQKQINSLYILSKKSDNV